MDFLLTNAACNTSQVNLYVDHSHVGQLERLRTGIYGPRSARSIFFA
jgi:hypothetical protein